MTTSTVSRTFVVFMRAVFCRMQTKLTLWLDEQLVKQAEQHAKQAGRSISEMVADYLSAIVSAEPQPSKLAPKVAQLMGALEGAGVDEADYHAHLEGKYLEDDV